MLANGKCENGLYVLTLGSQAFVFESQLKASFELWHLQLGHMSFDTILLLNKLGCLFVTSILPKSGLCSSFQMSK